MECVKLDGFLGRQLSKILNKAIKAKLGIDPSIDIKLFSFEEVPITKPDEPIVRVKLEAIMDQSKFESVIEEVTK